MRVCPIERPRGASGLRPGPWSDTTSAKPVSVGSMRASMRHLPSALRPCLKAFVRSSFEQAARDRLLERQHHRASLDADLRVRRERRAQRLGEPEEVVAEGDLREIAAVVEQLVHERHRANPVRRFVERRADRRFVAPAGLQREQAGQHLEVVLHPVVHFLDERHLLGERAPQLLFGAASLGQVAHRDDRPPGPRGRCGGRRHLRGELTAVELLSAPLEDRSGVLGECGAREKRVDAIEERARGEALHRAEQLEGPRVAPTHLSLLVEQKQRVRAPAEDRLEGERALVPQEKRCELLCDPLDEGGQALVAREIVRAADLDDREHALRAEDRDGADGPDPCALRCLGASGEVSGLIGNPEVRLHARLLRAPRHPGGADPDDPLGPAREGERGADRDPLPRAVVGGRSTEVAQLLASRLDDPHLRGTDVRGRGERVGDDPRGLLDRGARHEAVAHPAHRRLAGLRHEPLGHVGLHHDMPFDRAALVLHRPKLGAGPVLAAGSGHVQQGLVEASPRTERLDEPGDEHRVGVGAVEQLVGRAAQQLGEREARERLEARVRPQRGPSPVRDQHRLAEPTRYLDERAETVEQRGRSRGLAKGAGPARVHPRSKDAAIAEETIRRSAEPSSGLESTS